MVERARVTMNGVCGRTRPDCDERGGTGIIQYIREEKKRKTESFRFYFTRIDSTQFCDTARNVRTGLTFDSWIGYGRVEREIEEENKGMENEEPKKLRKEKKIVVFFFEQTRDGRIFFHPIGGGYSFAGWIV